MSCEAFNAQHFVKGVVEGTKIGVNLGLQITRQKAELLPCLDCGTGEDDSVYLTATKSRYRHCDGKISFSGTRRSDTKGDSIRVYCLYIVLLSYRLRLYGLTLGGDTNALVQIRLKLGESVLKAH